MSNLFSEINDPTVYSVTALCNELNTTLTQTYKNIYLKGELSGFMKASSGHCYFTVKDDASVLSAVMFKFSAGRLDRPLENGKEYIFRGVLRVYNKRGQIQFECLYAELAGMGTLHLAFERLKKKLRDEGLFDPSRKKKIPFLPTAIGIVTSPTGAVIHDMQAVITRKFPNSRIQIYPVAVQGNTAVDSILKGIDYFNNDRTCDVIIIARGGGSFEELSVFNDERLARRIATSHIPIVSGIGHETDFTVCDFVADYRAATPTAAAEAVVPDKEELVGKIAAYRSRLYFLTRDIHRKGRTRFLISQTKLSDPTHALKTHYLKLDDVTASIRNEMRNRLHRERLTFDKLAGRLGQKPLFHKIQQAKHAVYERRLTLIRQIQSVHTAGRHAIARNIDRLHLHNPATVLKRGFVKLGVGASGKRPMSVNDIQIKETLRIELQDGLIKARTESITHFK